MAVMNDMLRSPHISAHLSAQQGVTSLTPMHGRPRSHTAPSTPLVEAPFVEPVELHGSLLANKKSVASLHQSLDGEAARMLIRSPTNENLETKIERPQSSPQEQAYRLSVHPRQSSDSLSRSGNLVPPAQMSPRSKSSSPSRFSSRVGIEMLTHSSEDTLVAHDSGSVASSMKRPSLSVLHPWSTKSPSVPESQTPSQVGSTYVVPQLGPAMSGRSSSQQHIQQANTEAALMEQMALMRATHEAHLSSLREAHLKEIETHRSYIAFLEKRRGVPQTQVTKQHLTIDTSHASSRIGDLQSADASATTMQSWESSLENQKRASQESAIEVETLKRKLSLCRKAVAEANEVRRERDQLRDAAERSGRRILQLKDIVRKAKEHEKSLKNAVGDFEARLIDANNERIDVLEGFDEASSTVRRLTEHGRGLKKEIEDLRSRLFYSTGRHASDTTLALPETNTTLRPKHSRTKSDIAGLASTNDPLLQQLRDLKQLVATRDATIRQLQGDSMRYQNKSDSTATDHRAAASGQYQRITDLELSLTQCQQKLAEAQADCERYNSLLHNELRRQSRYAAQRPHASMPKIEADAFAEAMEKIQFNTWASDASAGTESGRTATASLERELEYCFKEIVLYKMDIRGYRKDIRRAQTEIESLRATSIPRPPTPDRESASSVASNASSEKRQQQDQCRSDRKTMSGLGILLPQPPQTPTRTVSSATATALMSTPLSVPSAVSSPPTRPKTPLGTHKKLPRPPTSSRTPSPLLAQRSPPTTRIQRAETLRSMSDSIISSYAKRGTPEPVLHVQTPPPPKERRSGPPKAVMIAPQLGDRSPVLVAVASESARTTL